jgi:16S rRNA (cytidine1402-2'-O)-methyltransferase
MDFLPSRNAEVVCGLKHFIVEDEKTARRFLKLYGYPAISEAQLYRLNEHTREGDVSSRLDILLSGADAGLMSDAGCPAIADPGAEVVKLAHRNNIEVIPLAGPSSVLFSVMASGFSGQNFAFNGYLPIDRAARIKRVRELEQLALRQKQAQFFIETPYRNQQLLDVLLATLSGPTQLFIGRDICGAQQLLKSDSVENWKKQGLKLDKRPVVFGIFC